MKKKVLIGVMVCVSLVLVVLAFSNQNSQTIPSATPDNTTSQNVGCNHIDVIVLNATPATCTKTGLSDGLKCSRCGKIIIEQEVIKTVDHTPSEFIIDIPATKRKDGEYHVECIICGEFLYKDIIPATGSVGLAYTINGSNCIITGIGTCTDSDLVIPHQIDGCLVTEIKSRAFYDCDTITEITIPKTITKIGTQIIYKADNVHTVNCYGDCIDENTDFLSYDNIETLLLGMRSIPDNLLKMSKNIKNLILSDSVQIIGERAFNAAEFENFTFGPSIIKLEDWAIQFIEAKNLYYTGDIESWMNIPHQNNRWGKIVNLYIDNKLVTNLVIPDGITEIGEQFMYCESIKKVTIPLSVTSIGNNAFIGCVSLSSIKIPDSVTSIGSNAFYGCTSLKSITIPDSVITIGGNAFEKCSNLKSVTFENTSNWVIIKKYTGTSSGEIEVSSEKLSNKQTAAELLTQNTGVYGSISWKNKN